MTENELIRRHYGLAISISRDFFLPGADEEDVEQEALIGLLEGIRCYEPGHGTTMASFSAGVIRRRLMDRVTRATRQKHMALSEAVYSGVDHLPGSSDPQRELEQRERLWEAVEAVAALSPAKRRVIVAHLNGLSLQEMADEFGIAFKSVDNALYRARLQLKAAA